MLKLASLSLVLSTGLFASESQPDVIEFAPERTISVVGPIMGKSYLEKASQIVALSATPGDINLFINSPGGSVIIMNLMLSAMEAAQATGSTIKCATPVYAASAAFTILAACDVRYVLRNSMLLFHPVRTPVMAIVKAKDAKEMAAELDEIDQALINYLLSKLDMDRKLFLKAFYDEKFWTASDLALHAPGFLTIVKAIKGIDMFQIEPEDGEPSDLAKSVLGAAVK